jgi:hypothetical protein
MVSQCTSRPWSYPQLSHFSPASKEFLLFMYNCVLTENWVLAAWREAIVILVLKPSRGPFLTTSYWPIGHTSSVCEIGASYPEFFYLVPHGDSVLRATHQWNLLALLLVFLLVISQDRSMFMQVSCSARIFILVLTSAWCIVILLGPFREPWLWC